MNPASPAPRIRLLVPDDLADALLLCRNAGWNQTRDDWLRLLDHEPEGCFVAQVDGRRVGTVTTTSYGIELAWIGMMLVHPKFRRSGVATGLIRESLLYLQRRGVQCIKLDATPAGQPLYERFGFQAEWTWHRWQRDVPDAAQPKRTAWQQPAATSSELTAGARELGAAMELDRQAFGVDRSIWLGRLAAQASVCTHARGFGMLRPGHLAAYLGPVTAADAEAARQIIDSLLRQARRTVFWDVPHCNRNAVQLAESLGFRPVRDLTRMWIGQRLLTPHIELQYGISEPCAG